MNIEQSKALKVGDWMHLNNDVWVDMVKGGRYKLIKVDGAVVQIVDGAGDVISIDLSRCLGDFDLVTTPTNTQWIPFDKERVSEAEGYRLSDTKESVTELKLYDSKDSVNVACLVNGYILTMQSGFIEMLVPVVVKYPCLARRDGDIDLVILYAEQGGWTPLTTAELAEIGLKQID